MKTKQTFMTRQDWGRMVRAEQDTLGDTANELIAPPLRKIVRTEVQVKDVDPNTGMHDIGFVISTDSVDREGDIIAVDGWDLEQYRANPVVLWAHDYRTPPVGKSIDVGIRDGKLVSIDRFTPEDINPFGAMIYRMVKGGFLKATSVGFSPTEWTYNEDHRGFDFIRTELLEHSVVPVPANPDALVMASKSGINLRPMREWVERMLDHDPSVQRFSLIPRDLAERAWKTLRDVEGVDIPPLTTGYFFTNDPKIAIGGWTDSVSVGTSDPNGSITTDTTTTIGDPTVYPIADVFRSCGVDVKDWVRELDNLIEDETETDMEEAIKELIGEIRGLREDLTKFVDTFQMKSPDPPDPTPDDDDVSEDDVRSMVREAFSEVMTATTGKLPD